MPKFCPEEIFCKYYDSWTEYGVTMCDCWNESVTEEDHDLCMETDGLRLECPHYEPCEVFYCEKHNQDYFRWQFCYYCYEEDFHKETERWKRIT